jgi:hypothetical protein
VFAAANRTGFLPIDQSYLAPDFLLYQLFSTMPLFAEDHAWCSLVTRHGAEIYGFPWLTITHNGQHDYVGDLEEIAA